MKSLLKTKFIYLQLRLKKTPSLNLSVHTRLRGRNPAAGYPALIIILLFLKIHQYKYNIRKQIRAATGLKDVLKYTSCKKNVLHKTSELIFHPNIEYSNSYDVALMKLDRLHSLQK